MRRRFFFSAARISERRNHGLISDPPRNRRVPPAARAKLLFVRIKKENGWK